MSFHCQVEPLDSDYGQQYHFNRANTVEENKYYVCFVTSEGDTTKGAPKFFYDSWFDSNRGDVPMNWAIHPKMGDLAPAMMEYLYDTATANDYFVGVQVYNLANLPDCDEFAALLKDDMVNTDLKVICSGFGPTPAAADVEDVFTPINPLGVFEAVWTGNGSGYASYLSDGVPRIGTGDKLTYWERLWDTWDWGYVLDMLADPYQYDDVIDEVVDEIETVAQAHSKPFIVVVYTNLHDYDKHPTLHEDIAAGLDSNYVVTRLDEALAAMRNWNPDAIDIAGDHGPVASDSLLKVWLKADSGVSTSGQSVTSWADQADGTGQGNNDATPIAGHAPTLVTNAALDNQAAIRFNGSDQGLNVAADGISLWNRTVDGGTFTAYVVMYPTDAYHIGDILCQGADIWYTYGYENGFQNGSGSFDTIWTDTSSISNNTPYILCLSREGNAAGETKMYINGAQSDDGTAISNLTHTGAINIGYQSLWGPHRYWEGDIAEVIVYHKKLNSYERNSIGYYLEDKYGLDTAYEQP